MELSIIIPTLNEEKYLPILLKEIKKQNFFDYEIIVADGGSKDKTLEIANLFGCIVTKGGKPAKGRNEGAKIAKGNLLFFIDADTLFLPPDFFQDLIKKFKEKNLDIATFPIYLSGSKLDKIVFDIYYFFARNLQKVFPLGWNSILVKKEVFEKLGGFDERVVFAEDLEFIQRAAKKFKYGFIQTKPIISSNRRILKDGRITYLKYLTAGLYIFFKGPIKKEIFKYDHNFS